MNADDPIFDDDYIEEEYLVNWSISITASSPQEAVDLARQIQLDPMSYAVVFEVTGPEGYTIIDLWPHEDDLIE